MNLSACRSLTTAPLTGTWYRAIQCNYWNSLLATAHSTMIPGRFNAGNPARPGFEILYLAEDHQVALYEVRALLGSPWPGMDYVPNPSGAWVVINVRIRLGRVADLTRDSQRRLIATTVQELTGDWRGYQLREPHPRLKPPYWTRVPTQRLGHALHNVRGLEGFLTYSARVATHRNLMVFPGKLRPGSFIRFDNPITGQTHTIP